MPACCTASQRGRSVYVCDTCGLLNLAVTLTPSQARFVFSQKRHVWLVGGQGEGKSYTAIVGILHHASRQPRTLHPLTGAPLPVRWAYLRDTHTSIRHITVPAVQRSFPGVFTFHDDYHVMRTQGLEVDLFGMDRTDDLSRIQGAEYDGIHIEEPAPIIAQGPAGAMVNAGMSREVFQVCATRMRGGGTQKRLQIGMNPADRSHWTFYERELNPAWADCTETVRIRPGENPHITAEDREAVKRAFKDRPDLYARYVMGKESEVYPGVSITPEYNLEWHRAPMELEPMAAAESHLWFDGGLNPTCVLAQLMPSGRVHLIDCVAMENAGMRQLIKAKLIPLLNSPKWRIVKRFRALGDDSLKNREQADSDYSGAKIIQDELAPWVRDGYEGGVQAWDLRREALKTLLDANVGGVAKLLVNPIPTPGEPWHRLHAALAGGYCYQVVNGVVQRDGPAKGIHSHCGDAISHAVARLFGIPRMPEPESIPFERQTQRAKGYAVGGYVPGYGG